MRQEKWLVLVKKCVGAVSKCRQLIVSNILKAIVKERFHFVFHMIITSKIIDNHII